MRGGRERSVEEMARGLSRAGCEVTVLCQSGSCRSEAFECKALPVSGSRLARLRRFGAAVQSQAASGRYDIVHTTLPIPGCDVYQPRGGTIPAQRAASLLRRGLLGRVGARVGWACNPVRRQMLRWEKQIASDSHTLCLAVSDMVARELETFYGPSENVRVVPNGVEAPRMSSEVRRNERRGKRRILGLEEEDPLFVTAATNFSLKGVAELLEAFARFREGWRSRSQRPARLVIIGRDQPVRYAALADRLGLSMDVEFVGPSNGIEPWLAAATGAVLLSWYDPCSRVVLEALACGTPAITTRYNGAAEFLSDGGGIVVDAPDDLRNIALAMATMARPEARAEMATACQALTRRVSMERHVEQLLDAYQEIRDRR